MTEFLLTRRYFRSRLDRLGDTLLRAVLAASRRQKQLLLLLSDVAFLNLALVAALLLDPGASPGAVTSSTVAGLAALLSLVGGATAWGLGLPSIKLNAYGWSSVPVTAHFAGVMSLVCLGAVAVIAPGLPGMVAFVYGLALFAVSVMGRVLMLRLLLWIYRRPLEQCRILIYGAGTTGMQLAAALATHNSLEPVAFIDDNPVLHGVTVAGLRVHPPKDAAALIDAKRIERVLLAMPQLSHYELSLKASRFRTLGVDVHAVPSFAQLAGTEELLRHVVSIVPDGLLGRDPLGADLPEDHSIFAGHSVMITGAGGSIGSELARQILRTNPAQIVLFDLSEVSLYRIDRELRELLLSGQTRIVARLGSVTDARTVRRVIAENGVDVVLHCAAYKHVPLVEDNQIAGLENNVFGTRVLADAARDLDVGHFVLVSTDKAVRPTGIMGASKRMAELVVQDLATRSRGTQFSIVRFGNVLGSSGSVVPLFREQIARGGPVTVTHGDVTRYFMTIGEAARLVLTAATFARGGDVFVLDMGKPVPIRRLAEQMIESAGLTVRSADNPGGDIAIEITGLRPGEKLHEELLIGAGQVTTPHPKILRAHEAHLSEIEVANMLHDLALAIDASDADMARRVVRRWVEGDNSASVAERVVLAARTPA